MKKYTCKHYTGSYHNTHCDVGVCYRDVTNDPDGPGSAYRIACHRPEGMREHGLKVLAETGPCGTCDKYEEPTDAEVDAHENQIKEIMQRRIAEMTIIAPKLDQIRRNCRGMDHRSVIECPRCKGKLHISHSGYNGHIWGKCETADCVAWME